MNFNGGQSARKGQQVRIVEFTRPQEVVVDAGNDLVFGLAPEDCDLLDAANQTWAALTPAQREVSPQTLAQDASLWPDRVKCFSGFHLDNGTDLPPGGEFDFLSIEDDGVHLYSAETNTNLLADFAQTDTIARARQRALIEPDKRPSRIAEVLRKAMVDADGKPVEDPNLDQTQVFALYYGASWCPPCRQFSPEFVKFINGVAAQNPHLTVVLMSNDEKDADMQTYMKEEKMPWRAVPLAALNKSPLLLGYVHGAIPQLAIVDRHGKLLADAYDHGRYVGPRQAMTRLSKLLDSGIAK
jgi:thiol-disulfide isomerase/thioredoxin